MPPRTESSAIKPGTFTLALPGIIHPALTAVESGERTGVSVEMAIRLSKAFGPSPETWLGMQMAYDLWQACERSAEISVEHFVDA